MEDFDIPKFYIIWKIQKNPIVDRPIVASCRWLTTTASIFVGEYLKEFINKFDTILEDTSSILKILETQNFPENCFLFTLDADSLYTNIPTQGYQSALNAISRLFKMFPINTGDRETDEKLEKERELVLDLLDFVLKNNLMEFHGEYFLQIFGIAMGTNRAPVLANLYLAMLEEQIKRECYYNPKLIWPLVLKRFIDDMFGIMVGTYEDLVYFVKVFNSYIPSINLNIIKWGKNVNFMDLEIFKSSKFYETGKFSIKTHQKEQNIFDYIPFRSNHPKHTFKNLVLMN